MARNFNSRNAKSYFSKSGVDLVGRKSSLWAGGKSLQKLTSLSALIDRVLEAEKRPLSADEIWKVANTRYYTGDIRIEGKTPRDAIEYKIYADISKNRNASPYGLTGAIPYRYYLRSVVTEEQAPRLIEEKPALTEPQGKYRYLEKDWVIEHDFMCLVRCLTRAARRVGRHYIHVRAFGMSEPVFRERVYCYELYHQLRNVLGDCFPYKLDGELDKAGHSIVSRRIGAYKLDYIVHVPGRMDRNLAVIQVKSTEFERKKLVDDIDILKSFIDEAGYYGGIMLVYGR